MRFACALALSLLALALSAGRLAPLQAAGGSADPARQTTASRLQVVYPKDGARLAAPSTFLVGSVNGAASLACNGQPVRLNQSGYFSHVVALKEGDNSFVLVTGDGARYSLTVFREAPPKTLPAAPVKIAASSLEPREDTGVAPGDIIGLSARATPGSAVSARIGARVVPLYPVSRLKGGASAGRELDAAYGLSFQKFPANSADLYCGFYRVAYSDRFKDARIQFTARKNRRSASEKSGARVSVVEQPLSCETAHDDTIVRLGPGQARTTPQPRAVRLLVDGWQGNSMRCLISPGRHVWIDREDLVFDPSPTTAPQSAVRTVNLVVKPRWTSIVIPLAQRLPFQIEQQLKPNKLTLRIFGATADTDWITESTPGTASPCLDHATWRQAGEGIYELTAHLKNARQWGFWAEYQGSDLVLNIKSPPARGEGEKPLAGTRICLDAGHGGDETGSIGPSGVPESDINLAISLRLREILQGLGATVLMTREKSKQSVSLKERVDLAVCQSADLLVSVHNNALPDGRDPWKEHGTSAYWYHPQSIELARTLKKAVAAATGFPDFGVYYQNLALTRPSQMPACLVEVGFMIHPDEFARLENRQTQEKAAEGIARGLTEYLAGND